MKTRQTLEWAEKFLKQYIGEAEKITSDAPLVVAITDLLKFHASILPESAEERLNQLEKKVSNLEADAMLGKFGGKR